MRKWVVSGCCVGLLLVSGGAWLHAPAAQASCEDALTLSVSWNLEGYSLSGMLEKLSGAIASTERPHSYSRISYRSVSIPEMLFVATAEVASGGDLDELQENIEGVLMRVGDVAELLLQGRSLVFVVNSRYSSGPALGHFVVSEISSGPNLSFVQHTQATHEALRQLAALETFFGSIDYQGVRGTYPYSVYIPGYGSYLEVEYEQSQLADVPEGYATCVSIRGHVSGVLSRNADLLFASMAPSEVLCVKIDLGFAAPGELVDVYFILSADSLQDPTSWRIYEVVFE